MKSLVAMPLVSVIMPAFNAQKYIESSILSVVSQNYINWELLIIDDSSTDNTKKISENFASKDARIKIISGLRKLKASGARNLGLENAVGDYVAFLDADDLWDSNKLEVQVSRLLQEDAAFICSAYNVIRADGRFIRTQNASKKLSLGSLLSKRSVVGCLTVVFDRNRIPEFRFREDMRSAEDYELWCRILKFCEANRLRVISESRTLASYRVHVDGKSRNKFKRILVHWKIYRHNLGLPFFDSAAYTVSYALNGVVDRLRIAK